MARLYEIDQWPESAKKDEYSPWETEGKLRAVKKTEQVWDEYAPLVFQNPPNKGNERRKRGLARVLDSWIWRLIRLEPWLSGEKNDEGRVFTPDDVIAKIKTNGPFPNVVLREERKLVDLFFDLTLAASMSDRDEKGVEIFLERYGVEVKTFAEKLAKKYSAESARVVGKSARRDVYAQFNWEIGSFEERDENFRRWRDYFLDYVKSPLKNYRGLAPLVSYLRVSIFRSTRKEEKNGKGRRLGREPRQDEPEPSDVFDKNQEEEALKRALFELKRENKEQFQALFMRFYDELEYLQIADRLGYDGSDDAKRKRAERKCAEALERLEKLLEKQKRSKGARTNEN